MILRTTEQENDLRAVRVAPLSYAQERLWFYEQLNVGNSVYNIPIFIELIKSLHVELFTQALNEIVRRHEILRTVFANESGVPVQKVYEHWQLDVQFISLEGMPIEDALRIAKELGEELAQRHFDLERLPLFHAYLFKLSGHRYATILNLHHIVADEWSFKVLVKELAQLIHVYSTGRASTLDELPYQYKDHVLDEKHLGLSKNFRDGISFWKKSLEGVRHDISFPTDYVRTSSFKSRGEIISFSLPEETSRGLAAYARRNHCTLYSLYLAAFQILFYRCSGEKDLVIGTPVANRNHDENQKLIGFFGQYVSVAN